jgi:hypothetical protein
VFVANGFGIHGAVARMFYRSGYGGGLQLERSSVLMVSREILTSFMFAILIVTQLTASEQLQQQRHSKCKPNRHRCSRITKVRSLAFYPPSR